MALQKNTGMGSHGSGQLGALRFYKSLRLIGNTGFAFVEPKIVPTSFSKVRVTAQRVENRVNLYESDVAPRAISVTLLKPVERLFLVAHRDAQSRKYKRLKPLGRPSKFAIRHRVRSAAHALMRLGLAAIQPKGETHVSSSRDTYSIGNLTNRFDFALTKTMT